MLFGCALLKSSLQKSVIVFWCPCCCNTQPTTCHGLVCTLSASDVKVVGLLVAANCNRPVVEHADSETTSSGNDSCGADYTPLAGMS